MSILVILLLVATAIYLFNIVRYHRKISQSIKNSNIKLKKIEGQYTKSKSDLDLIKDQKDSLLAEKERAIIESVRIEEQNKASLSRAQSDVESEYTKLRLEFSAKQEKEFQDMRMIHDEWVQEAIDEFVEYREELARLQGIIKVTEQKKMDEEMKENFIDTHSLKIMESDYEDMAILAECRSRLNRKTVLNSLVWNEFVQAPLQQLRKDLVSSKLSEEVSGIYRITNIENDRCYIGRATNISSRWTEHVKSSLNNPTTKFHKALSKVPLYLWTWEILEKCDAEVLADREEFWVEFYNSDEFGYNSRKGG